MTLERVKFLLSRMPHIYGVCIMGLCEPFLNPETPEILRWLKDIGRYNVAITTNGTIDLNEDKLDALLRADDFVFSIDTYDPETFRFLRGGADLERVMKNFRRLIEFKRARGLGRLDRPPIHINAVVTSRNFLQIPGLIKMLEPYADDLNYLMLDPVTRPDYQDFEDPLMLKRDLFEKHIGEFRRIAGASPLKIVGFDYMLERSFGWRDCHLSWSNIFVQPNGDVYFCYEYGYVLGNAFRANPLLVWNNKKARAFRRQLLTSNPPVEQCHFCNFARKGWQTGGIYYKTKKDVLGQQVRAVGR